MEELLPGVWHWSAPHPRIGFRVHSHWLSDAGAVFDPIEPPEGMPELEPAPTRIVLGCRHHLRDAEGFAAGLGGVPILAPRRGCTSSRATGRSAATPSARRWHRA